MAQSDDGFAPFDSLLAASDYTTSPWLNGIYQASTDLLQKLVGIPISQGDKQETGRTAKAFDSWIAHELRRAGFPADAVFPRMSRPRVLAEGLGPLEAKIDSLSNALKAAEADGDQLKPRELRRAIRAVTSHQLGSSSAYILGDFYAKQVDVGLSAWDRGPDILISTKTMFSAYGKNLKNRHEEAVGEISSLRRRHPMAAMGYAYLVRSDILQNPNAYAALYDILYRLRRARETFDATLLLIADWDDDDLGAGVRLIDEPAPELGAARFFEDIVTAVMERSPNRVHQEARRRLGGMPVGGLTEDDDEIDLSDGDDA